MKEDHDQSLLSSDTEFSNSKISSHLECPICLTTYCEPISLTCGHTFCRTCLMNSLRRNKKKCPSCRAVCNMTAEGASENVVIREIIKSLHPAAYAQRSEEAAKEKADWGLMLPIFYYNDCLFPGCTLSLHLFEPRYKLLAQRATETTRRFAYCPNFSNYQASIGDVVLIALLEDVEFLPDGRCLLEAKLSTRSEITDHFVEDGTQGLSFCRVRPMIDIPLSEEEQLVANQKMVDAVALWGTCVAFAKESCEQRFGPIPSTGATSGAAQAFSLWLTAVSGGPDSERFALLRSKNTLERFARSMPRFEMMIRKVSAPRSSPGPRSRGGAGNADADAAANADADSDAFGHMLRDVLAGAMRGGPSGVMPPPGVNPEIFEQLMEGLGSTGNVIQGDNDDNDDDNDNDDDDDDDQGMNDHGGIPHLIANSDDDSDDDSNDDDGGDNRDDEGEDEDL